MAAGTLAFPIEASNPRLVHRRALAAVFRQVRPRLLFAPFWEDAHPDHTAATKLVEDARFWSKLTKSDIPGPAVSPRAHSLLLQRSPADRRTSQPASSISRTRSTPSWQPYAAYRSQLVDNQPEGRPGVIDSVCDRTRYWGQLAGVRHAEPFASREPIGLSGLDQLLL